ncbi:S8 family peptidase [Thomasclavelia ramosa]|uniref:S8 family peptidase n=1 Tax=Thomasclavelia ramosa TaxID=1547 RepID=UPI0035618788
MNNNYELGKVIVALNINITCKDVLDYYIDLVLDGIDYEKAEIIFHSKNTESLNEGTNIVLIYLKDKNPHAVTNAVAKLSSSPYIVYAEPDYIEEMHIISNDPLYNQLWGIQKINAPLAWDYTTGDSSISVGVIDTGIDQNHPDIRENMWTTWNGRLIYGWNFADNSSDSMDLDGHGSHVAGTIGAVGNNRIGITGVCWQVRVAALKFGLDVASAIAAIDFANYYKISILNASWGGRAYSQALKDAIDQYDGLFVASAGNDGTNNDVDPMYPASYDCKNIISVAAVDPYDTLARFSNYGLKTVDIAAPGTNILSLDLAGEYSPLNGTSMAAPHVAGAAALLKSSMPNISTITLKRIILSSAMENPELKGKILTGGILDMETMFKLANCWHGRE